MGRLYHTLSSSESGIIVNEEAEILLDPVEFMATVTACTGLIQAQAIQKS